MNATEAADSSVFATDTAVAGDGTGRYRAEVASRWNVGSNPNGGYLLAIATRAMLAAAGRPDPITVTAHYLAPPEAGPVEVDTAVIKPGRNFVNVTAEVWQGERERVRLLGSFADLAAQRGPSRVAGRPPDIPPPERCVPLATLIEATGGAVPGVLDRFDVRLPADTRWGRVSAGGPLEITGWIRFADGGPLAVVSLVAFADAFPPALIGSVAAGWVPTLELTVHVRARPAGPWLLGSFRTRFLVEGMLEEDGEIWDTDGRLVALSRQLALVIQPRPRSASAAGPT